MTDANSTWRVAIVGSGPAAFYTAEALFKSGVDGVTVDLGQGERALGLATTAYLCPSAW